MAEPRWVNLWPEITSSAMLLAKSKGRSRETYGPGERCEH